MLTTVCYFTPILTLCSLCFNTLSAVMSFFSAEQKEAVRQRLNKVCLGLCAIFLAGATANFGRVYLMRLAGQNITANLRNKVRILIEYQVFFIHQNMKRKRYTDNPGETKR